MTCTSSLTCLCVAAFQLVVLALQLLSSRRCRAFLLQRPPLVGAQVMTRFHSDDYVNFLKVVSPDNMHDYLRELQRCTERALLYDAAACDRACSDVSS